MIELPVTTWIIVGAAAVLLVLSIALWRKDAVLQRQRERTTQILENITDAFISLNHDWRFTHISPRAVEIYERMGKRPKDMIGRRYWEELPAGTAEEKEFRRAIAQNAKVTFESLHAGSNRWFEMNAYPTPEGLSVFFRDITQRRAAGNETLQALRELNDVKSALDQHAIVAITDAKGKITYVNEKFCAISQYQREELIGQDHRIINSGYHSKEFIRSIWQTIGSGNVWKGEIKNMAKDGSSYWVDTTIVPYLGTDGRPIQYIAIRADITERKRAEEQTTLVLRELNDVKAALDEHAIVAITNSRGTITYVNDKFCAISKYSREELIGQDHRLINSSYHPKGFIRSIWQTIGKGQVWKGEIKNKAKDGSHYWVDTTIVPYLGSDGKPVQYIAIRADITERKRAEVETAMAFRELNDVKAAMDEHAIVAITDARGRITYVNDKFCAISQYSREELIGKDHRIINSGYHPKEFIRTIWTTIGEGRTWKGEIRNRAKDGSFYWVDTTIVPYLGEDGKPNQYIAIRADITERKKAEEQTSLALRELNEVRSALDEHAIVAITDPSGKITYVNDKFCAISKYSREELIGQDHRIINSSHHPKTFIRNIWQTIGAGHVWKGEIKNRAKDDTFYWVDTTIVPYLGSNGKPRQYIAIRADITERKKAEEALQQAQYSLQAHASTLEQTVAERTAQLREKIGELEAFSYSISHDMRQPLRSMQGYATILLDELGDSLEKEPKRYLERIKFSSNRLDRLIQDVLTYSKATRVEGELTVLQLDPMVRDIVETYPALRNIDIDVRIGGGAVLGYEVALTQSISNLLGNAVKFMPPGQTPRVQVWSEVSGEYVRLLVKDNGIGIAPADQQRIFEIFARVHGDEVYDGTGIGLSIVKKAVEKMGGRIGLSSESGKGSVFWIDLKKATNGSS